MKILDKFAGLNIVNLKYVGKSTYFKVNGYTIRISNHPSHARVSKNLIQIRTDVQTQQKFNIFNVKDVHLVVSFLEGCLV